MKARGLFILAGLPVILGCLGLGEATGTIQEPDENARYNILFVGNSLTYANELPGMLEALVDSALDGPAHAGVYAFANFGLEDHWIEGSAREAIAVGGWDVVVLQQGPSATEGRPSLLEYSQLFDEEISGVGARTALYMVWPSEARFFDFDGVSESYTMAAQRIGGLLYPVGEAWLLAWQRDSTLELYGPDRFHPSEAGTYLAALVMLQQLTGVSPLGLPATFELPSGFTVSIPADTAMILQEAAAEANALYALP
jgi:hypothetical protein